MRCPSRLAVPLAALFSLILARASDAQSPPPADPAARGLDVFVHAPPAVAPGGVLPVDVEAVGFPTIVAFSPLPHAILEAAWNPETLGEISAAPPPVTVHADADGRAHLEVPVPDGDEADLELLVGVRSGPHARTRTLAVHRGRLLDQELFVPDTHVVPGSTLSAWVLVKSAGTGEPVAGAPVHVALIEGGVPRFEARLVSDAAGTAMARVPIPRNDDPAWAWTLSAYALAGGRHHGAASKIALTPREETPGTPSLRVAWQRAAVLAGDHVGFRVGVRDATDQPVAGLPVRYWIGPKGTRPPKDEEGWLAASTRAVTDAAGEIEGGADAPSTVVKGAGTTLQLVVKANVDGHDLEGEGVVKVGAGAASVELLPEASALVPGIAQRLLLRVLDGHGRPIAAPFLIEGDGLRAEVRTDASGEAELGWKTPPDLGAARNVGPCAGGVAASVRVRATIDVPALLPRRDPFELCLPIDRDAAGLARADRSTAHAGDAIHVTVTPSEPSREAKDRTIARGPWSVVVEAENRLRAASAWIDDGERGGDIVLPKGAMGPWRISAAMPGTRRAARVLGASILVTPRALPRLTATLAGGRAAPGGAVDVDVALTDGKGHPMAGSVAAVLIDAHGGGSTQGIEAIDTRRSLCRALAVGAGRCDAVVEGDPALDLLRRAELARRAEAPLGPAIDPGAHVTEELRRAFASVLLSLEGAVRDASRDPDQLRDVRRKVGRGWQWNPELLTLVTAAIDPPPETPGGEPLTLADLIAVDPQVTFDNVARRISRAKLFQVLVAVRAFRHEHALDPDEPALRDPNALLRRLVREGKLQGDDLVDPWGGTLQFVRGAGPALPFLGVIKGFELHAPGPDGALGGADDVRDPFERVLKSGTPYAEAVEEDRVLDARSEMEVGDATVEAWQQLFQHLWGDTLGESSGAGGLALSGVGEGGGGRSDGIGLGSIGTLGHGRGTMGVELGVAFWSPPRRTDASGKLRLSVPLRDVETTWRLALVGVPDGGTPATAALEIPVALPLSARVDGGAAWIEGDEGSVPITVRNRSPRAVSASLAVTASGAAELVEPAPGGALTLRAEIPAGGASVVHARVRTARAGTARLDVRLTADGAPDDALSHTWEVRAPGEPTDFTSARWIEDEAKLSLTMPPKEIRIVGAPRLVLERGLEPALAGALESMDPDEQTSPRALADGIEIASRIRRWALARGGEEDPLAERAADLARRATGRLAAYAAIDKESARTPIARALPFAPSEEARVLGAAGECPEDGGGLDARLEAVDAEPPLVNGAARPCWDALVGNATHAVEAIGDAEQLARLLLAVIERPHRRALAENLAARVRERVALKPTGAMRLPDELAARRAARATVWAALLRSVHLGTSAASAERLASWIGVQRDGQGGYGSSLATRAVVRALLAESAEALSIADTSRVTRVTIEGAGVKRELDVPPSARLVVPLPADAVEITVRVMGPGVVARLERPVLRLWSHPPSAASSPLHVEATWPEAKAGRTGTLRLQLRQALGPQMIADLTVPLPPGVTLAAPIDGVRQVQGALSIRRDVAPGEIPNLLEIPLRFALEGRFTVPELRARVAFDEVPRALAPARPIRVE